MAIARLSASVPMEKAGADRFVVAMKRDIKASRN